MFLTRKLPQLFCHIIRKPNFIPNINSKHAFHKSSSSQGPIPFLAAIIIKDLIKLTAMGTGSLARRWWKLLPKDKKSAFLKRHKVKFQILAGAATISLSAFYYSHLEYTPITKRARFMYYSPEDIKAFGNIEIDKMRENHSFLSQDHPHQQRLDRTFKRIYEGNKDVSQMVNINWKISAVDNLQKNAFSLSDGHIYMFGGMLDSFKNEDQLAGMLSHEMAHVILKHSCERINRTEYFDTLKIVLIGLIWLFVPYDVLAAFSHYILNRSNKILVTYPYSRKLEMEADEVGLQLISKACYDSREFIAFWINQSLKPEIPDLFSTHPSSRKRIENLDLILPKMLELRLACGCCELKDKIILMPRYIKREQNVLIINVSP